MTDTPDTLEPQTAGMIVALGASAGGLEALDRFFSALDPDIPAAFVVIQHLSPSHKTMMDALLGRKTRMPVSVAQEGDVLRPGRVHVIPSGVMMALINGRLHLHPRPEEGLVHPINEFFHSLSISRLDKIVGIVLSGTGSDGSEGLCSITEAGGWALAQTPTSASFDGMPLNALATGAVHESDTPENLARIVARIARSTARPGLLMRGVPTPFEMDSYLGEIGSVIGINLNNYKPQTLIRRLERRTLATGKRDLSDYMAYLKATPDERGKLRREMLIPVTTFFRDREAFDELVNKIIRPDLLKRMNETSPRYRAWSVGCATGQEAYTLAIAIFEVMRELGIEAEVKIFASDIEDSYLSTASAGRYPGQLLHNIPPELRNRYFTPVDETDFQVTPRLRRAIVFSQHDVLHDPPFLHLDLVVCRNMTIYLKPDAQERALRRIIFGLELGASLFLGSSETPGNLSTLLDTVSGRFKLYRMRGQLRHLSTDDILLVQPRFANADRRRIPAPPQPLDDASRALGPTAACLIQAYVPPTVIVDSNREVRHVFGDMIPYLRFREGQVSLDLMQLLPERLAAIVSTLIFSAVRDRAIKTVVVHPADAPELNYDAPIRIDLRPIVQGPPDSPVILAVSFERLAVSGEPHDPALEGDDINTLSVHRASELEAELERVRATLKITIEELGSANEELQASNEELMAANEELQSTNEELQSVNEELHTVNAELQEKILQLNEAYADLDGLSQAARIPLIFLDGLSRITRFSTQATELFRLRDQDMGRPLMDIRHSIDFPDLEACIEQALLSQKTLQREARSEDGRDWLVSIQPFVGRSNEESRIVLSLIDVSSIKAKRFLQSVIDAAPQNLAVLDRSGNIRMVNRAWQVFGAENGASSTLVSGNNVNYLDQLSTAAKSDSRAQRVFEELTELLEGRREHVTMIYPCHSPTEKRWFMMHASPLDNGAGCVVTHLDVTNIDLAEPEREDDKNVRI
jgi:two-component system CheB/CheR fusion protein